MYLVDACGMNEWRGNELALLIIRHSETQKRVAPFREASLSALLSFPSGPEARAFPVLGLLSLVVLTATSLGQGRWWHTAGSTLHSSFPVSNPTNPLNYGWSLRFIRNYHFLPHRFLLLHTAQGQRPLMF